MNVLETLLLSEPSKGPRSGSLGRRTLKASQNDARYPAKVTVFYPLHPFYGGGEFPVVRRYGTGRVEQVEVKTARRRQVLPLWMTDQDHCRQFSVGADPRCSVPALWELAALLRASGCHVEADE